MTYRQMCAREGLNKQTYPHKYCPTKGCLWRTGGGYCPRHQPKKKANGTSANT